MDFLFCLLQYLHFVHAWYTGSGFITSCLYTPPPPPPYTTTKWHATLQPKHYACCRVQKVVGRKGIPWLTVEVESGMVLPHLHLRMAAASYVTQTLSMQNAGSSLTFQSPKALIDRFPSLMMSVWCCACNSHSCRLQARNSGATSNKACLLCQYYTATFLCCLLQCCDSLQPFLEMKLTISFVCFFCVTLPSCWHKVKRLMPSALEDLLSCNTIMNVMP